MRANVVDVGAIFEGLFNLGSDRCFACVRKSECPRKWRRYTRSSVNNTFLSRRTLAGAEAVDPSTYLNSIYGDIREMLEDGIEIHTSFRWLLSASVVFERTVEDIFQETRFDFYSREQILSRADQIDEQIESAISRLLTQIHEMAQRESNFVFQRVFSSTVRLARYNPIGESSLIDTPKELAAKRAIINVHNTDTRCFLYAVASAIHPAKTNINRPAPYEKYFSEFNITGLRFPLAPKDISKFEDLNPDIAVTVVHYDADRVIVPLVHSKHLGRKHEVNLFLLSEECETTAGNLKIAAAIRQYKYHYTWIKHPSRLLAAVTKGAHKVYVCFNCFRRFTTEQIFNKHRSI